MRERESRTIFVSLLLLTNTPIYGPRNYMALETARRQQPLSPLSQVCFVLIVTTLLLPARAQRRTSRTHSHIHMPTLPHAAAFALSRHPANQLISPTDTATTAPRNTSHSTAQPSLGQVLNDRLLSCTSSSHLLTLPSSFLQVANPILSPARKLCT